MGGGVRVTVVGEALVDLLWEAGATELRAVPGGSPANVAVGLHRLDQPVTLLTTWGDDPPGAVVGSYLASTGLDVRRAATLSSRTTVALAYLGARGAATYDFLASWDPLALTVPEDTSVLHTGSLAVIVEPGARHVLRLCREQRDLGRTVVADLNVRPAIQPDQAAYRAAGEALAGVTDVLKASDEDLAWLYPELTPVAAARVLLGFGPKLVVVTLGADGALAVTVDTEVRVVAPDITVVDTVGAGDTFQAALLAALADEGGPSTEPSWLHTVLTRCTAAAAISCARSGANPPTAEELSAFQTLAPPS